jgi:hypothetical protein
VIAPPRSSIWRVATLACGLASLTVATPSRAEAPAGGSPPSLPGPRALEPERVQGVVRPGREAGSTGREVAGVLLFVPRKLEALVFLAHSFAARILRDEHVVSRFDELFSPPPGTVTFFPTLFFASRQPPSAGIRVLARGTHVATSLAVGSGGKHNISVENRIRFSWAQPLPFEINIEGLADLRSGLLYTGVGQSPAEDPRNHFRAVNVAREATYLEQRGRGIADLSIWPHPELELLLSVSYTQSHISDVPGAEPLRLGTVFSPGTVPGAVAPTRIFYGEQAVRFDTRPVIGRPTPGVLLALYGGVGRGTRDDPSRFFRVGGRAAVFLPIVRPANILSLKLTVDAIAPGSTDPGAIPFTALVNQPDFRGFDTRRDHLGVVASVDYRWSLMHFLGARLFVDAATVAPRIPALVAAPPRIAAGFGIDIFGETTEIGQLAVSFTAEGARLLLSFGLARAFGDRQHRD